MNRAQINAWVNIAFNYGWAVLKTLIALEPMEVCIFQILVHIESKLSLYQYIVLQKKWKMHKRPNLSIPVTPKLL